MSSTDQELQTKPEVAPKREPEELEPYFAGSPVADAFAPGMLDEWDLVAPNLTEETPWRGRTGHAPDLSRGEKRVRRKKKSAPAPPNAAVDEFDALVQARAQGHVEAEAPNALAAAAGAADAAEPATPTSSAEVQVASVSTAVPPVGVEPGAWGGPADAPAVATTASDIVMDSEAAEDGDLGTLRVLVVHPNLGTRRQVAAALGEMGVEVSTCGEAEQAVLQVLHDRPDAVVSEIGTPDLDALTLCRNIVERAPGTPVLLVAPGDDEANYSLAMESGAADYLRRPLTPQFLGERLRVAVVASRAGSQLRTANVALQTEVQRGQEGTRTLSRQLRRQELKMQSLFELSKNVFGCLELDELYHGFLLTAMGQLGLQSGVLFHLDSSSAGRVIEVVSRGVSSAEAGRLLDFRAGLGAYLLRAPQTVVLGEDRCPRELQAEVESLRQSGFAVACPMASKGVPVGVALFGAKVSAQGFTVDDLVLLSAVCNFAGPALESARLYTELHRTYLSTVRAFVSSLEAKDTYTRGHSERVSDYARGVGVALGLKKQDLDMLVFGAVLHDIGKIGVAEGILNKPGPLTPEEWRIVRAHPEMGARIVSHIQYLEPAVGLILHHHERIDGRGYPHGLAGDDIELGARIVTVVDAFDAMTTHRPYRRAMDAEQAVRLLRQHAGRQFDAKVVDVFVGLIESGTLAPPV